MLSREFRFKPLGGHCGLFSMGHEFNPPKPFFAAAVECLVFGLIGGDINAVLPVWAFAIQSIGAV